MFLWDDVELILPTPILLEIFCSIGSGEFCPPSFHDLKDSAEVALLSLLLNIFFPLFKKVLFLIEVIKLQGLAMIDPSPVWQAFYKAEVTQPEPLHGKSGFMFPMPVLK